MTSDTIINLVIEHPLPLSLIDALRNNPTDEQIATLSDIVTENAMSDISLLVNEAVPWMVKRKIHIRGADGSINTSFQVSGSDTIGKLKDALAVKEGNLVLGMNREVFDDEKTCQELGLKEGDVLTVSVVAKPKEHAAEKQETVQDEASADGKEPNVEEPSSSTNADRIAPGAKIRSRSAVPTYKTEYVQEHSSTRNFYHRGRGYWAEGLPPAGSDPKIAVRGPDAEKWKQQSSEDDQARGGKANPDFLPEDGDMKDDSSNDATATVNRIAPRAKSHSRSAVPTYKTEYVEEHSSTRNFYHRGKGFWAEGLPRAGTDPKIAVRGPDAEKWKQQSSVDFKARGGKGKSRRKSKAGIEHEEEEEVVEQ